MLFRSLPPFPLYCQDFLPLPWGVPESPAFRSSPNQKCCPPLIGILSAKTVSPSLLSPPPFVKTAVRVAGTLASSESPSSDDVKPLTLSVEGVKKKDIALILPPGLTLEEGSEPLPNREEEVKPSGKFFGEEGLENILLLTPMASNRPVLVPKSEGFETNLEPLDLVARI